MIRIPISNDTDGEILVGLEPEGDTIPLRPGQTCTIQASGPWERLAALDFHIEYSPRLISVCLMCLHGRHRQHGGT